MTDTETTDFQDFEKKIVEHWKTINLRSIEPIDFLDAVLDFMSLHPNVDPEDLKFSGAFKDRLAIDAMARKLLNRSDREKREDEDHKTLNELDI